MENSNNLTSTILQSSETAFPSYSSSSDEGTGFFGLLSNISAITWLVIILVLAFLGFNIFVYLAKGTQDITNFFSPIIQAIFGTAATATGQVIDVSAEGAKAVVKGTSGVLDSGLSAVQSVTPNKAHSSVQSHPVENSPSINNSGGELNSSNKNDTHYEADVAPSSIQGGKAGWCYIGEEKGYRT